MDLTDHWTGAGHPDMRVTHFLCVCERSKAVVAVCKCPGGSHALFIIPFTHLVRLSDAGRLRPWTLDDLHEVAITHIDADRNLLAG
jgi:hypothetical protein